MTKSKIQNDQIRGRRSAFARVAGAALATAGAAAFSVLADELYLEDVESYASPAAEKPELAVVRPGEDWVFLDLAVQKARAAESRPGEAAAIRAEFESLRCRLHHQADRATFSLFVFPVASGEKLPDAKELARRVKADLEATFSDIAMGEEGAFTLPCGRTGVKHDLVGTPLRAAKAGERDLAGPFFVSRIDCPVPEAGAVVTCILEVPKEAAKRVLPGYRKILKKLKV